MKNVRNLFSALAFVFAIGAAFAFTPNASLVTTYKGSPADCDQEFECVLTDPTNNVQCTLETYFDAIGCQQQVTRYKDN